MIKKVSFRNFKAYRSLDLELEPLTVLVGPNASGKTTLLQGLSFLSQVADKLLAGGWGFSPEPLVQSYGVKMPVELSASGVWGRVEGSARAFSEAEPRTQPKEEAPSLAFRLDGTWGGKRFYCGDAPGKAPTAQPSISAEPGEQPVFVPPLEQFRSALGSTVVLRFEARKLAEASYSEEPVPVVGADGSGLASVLAHIKLSQDELFAEIELALKQVVPTVRRIRIERARVAQTVFRTLALDEQTHLVPEQRTLWGQQVVLDMKGAKGVAASDAGEGTLMALGLLTVLLGPRRPKLVLLDDIEMALHPAAQGKLIEVLRRIQAREPELQIVATSHSPFVLNFLKPEEVRITSQAENGFARCVPMTSHPDFERWKDVMSPGEFWSTVGESWMHKAKESVAPQEPPAHE